MLNVRPPKLDMTSSSLKSATRFFWTSTIRSKNRKQENISLAAALNLLVKPTEPTKTYKPSLYDSLTKGSVEEQFNKVPIHVPIANDHVSDKFISNILHGIKSSNVSTNHRGVNYSQLYEMNRVDLSAFIANVDSQEILFDIMETFQNHNKLTPRVLTDIILNRRFHDLDKSPIDLIDLKQSTNFQDLDVYKIQIVLLKKYHDLKQPLNIVKNLKHNFDSIYLPLIETRKLTPFYEKIIWHFTFDYLNQFKEPHYIETLNNLRTSFLIWETTKKRKSTQISQEILNFHTNLNDLQKLFLETASSVEDPTHISSLRKLSMKYRIYELHPEDAKLESFKKEFGDLVLTLNKI